MSLAHLVDCFSYVESMFIICLDLFGNQSDYAMFKYSYTHEGYDVIRQEGFDFLS